MDGDITEYILLPTPTPTPTPTATPTPTPIPTAACYKTLFRECVLVN